MIWLTSMPPWWPSSIALTVLLSKISTVTAQLCAGVRAAWAAAVEDAVDKLPDGVVDTPLPWDERALIAMMATTKAPMPTKALRTQCLFLRGLRGGCGPYP
jgi:hypothetical protein